jgi:hypothetical protein
MCCHCSTLQEESKYPPGRNVVDDIRDHSAVTPMKDNYQDITALYLKGNLIKTEGPRELAKVLRHHSHVIYLDLSYNKIGHEGAQYICKRYCDLYHSLY